MQLESLREFIALANYGSFRKAAEALFISQPTLSNHIKALETELGFPLIDHQRSWGLTQAGMVFVSTAQELVQTFDASVAQCRKLSRHDAAPSERVRITATDTTEGRRVIEQVLDRAGLPFQCENRDLTAPPFAPFLRDETDILSIYDTPALRQQADALGLACEPFAQEPCVVAMDPGNPLAGRSLSAEDVTSQTIYMSGDTQYADYIAVVAAMLDVVPTSLRVSVVPKKQPGIMGDLARDGIAITTRRFLESSSKAQAPYAVFTEVGGRPLRYRLMLVHRKNEQRPLVRRTLDELLAQAADGTQAS